MFVSRMNEKKLMLYNAVDALCSAVGGWVGQKVHFLVLQFASVIFICKKIFLKKSLRKFLIGLNDRRKIPSSNLFPYFFQRDINEPTIKKIGKNCSF